MIHQMYDSATPQRKAFLRKQCKLGLRLYRNRHMRRSWLQQTIALFDSGKHALQTGGWINGQDRTNEPHP